MLCSLIGKSVWFSSRLAEILEFNICLFRRGIYLISPFIASDLRNTWSEIVLGVGLLFTFLPTHIFFDAWWCWGGVFVRFCSVAGGLRRSSEEYDNDIQRFPIKFRFFSLRTSFIVMNINPTIDSVACVRFVLN